MKGLFFLRVFDSTRPYLTLAVFRALGLTPTRKSGRSPKNSLPSHTKYGGLEDPVSSLSGGNQQKVALAKWLAANCQVIILDEPTRGVDVGAKSEIYSIINSLAQDGAAVIMISSEMEEIINMCDRAVVMRQGIVTGELDKKELNEQGLIALAMGVA